MKRTDLDDGEGEELVELEGELVPQLPLVEVGEGGVPVGEVRARLPLRLHVLQRHRNANSGSPGRAREPASR